MNAARTAALATSVMLSLSAHTLAQAPAAPAEQPAEPTPRVAEPAAPPTLVGEPTEPAPRPGDAGKRLTVSIAPYAWLTSFSGDATVRNITFDASASFTDILQESDRVFGLMGAVDISYERLVFQFNATWSTAEISKSRSVLVDGTVGADADIDTAWVEFMGGYRFLDRPIGKDPASRRRMTVDGFVGGRITSMDIDLTVRATEGVTLPDGTTLAADQSRQTGQSEEWFEPFVGARVGLDLTERWSLSLRGDIGGFGLFGSQFAWQTAAVAGYRWHMDGWDLGLFAGYRALGQDYSSGGFGWDVITHGPLLGATFVLSF